jgi:serine/threonine-protein kinase RsbW
MAATSGAPDRGMSPSEGSSALAGGMWWRRDFPGDESQLGGVRRWLKSLLPDCPSRDDVVLVATELGSNAVRGQGCWFAVERTWHTSAVREAVADCGAPGAPRVIEDPAGEHGRGMLVVRGLPVRTGVCGAHRGRLVWADVPQDQYEAAIRDGQDGLASRFAGVPAGFGRSTLQWWALVGGELVAAPSAEELASLLSRAVVPPPPGHSQTWDTACADVGTVQAAIRDQQPGVDAPQSRHHRGPLTGGEQHRTGLGGRGGPGTPSVAQARLAYPGLPVQGVDQCEMAGTDREAPRTPLTAARSRYRAGQAITLAAHTLPGTAAGTRAASGGMR